MRFLKFSGCHYISLSILQSKQYPFKKSSVVLVVQGVKCFTVVHYWYDRNMNGGSNMCVQLILLTMPAIWRIYKYRIIDEIVNLREDVNHYQLLKFSNLFPKYNNQLCCARKYHFHSLRFFCISYGSYCISYAPYVCPVQLTKHTLLFNIYKLRQRNEIIKKLIKVIQIEGIEKKTSIHTKKTLQQIQTSSRVQLRFIQL